MKKILIFIIAIAISGCLSIPEMNSKFSEIDRAWLLEYQKHEDLYRFRVVDIPYSQSFSKVKQTFNQLGLPVTSANFNNGVIVASVNAPTPLSKEEWLQVREIEQPRVREIGGWMFYIAKDPKDYIITVRARLKAVGEKTLILLEYELDMPEYREMGLIPNRVAPPSAVKIGSLKFWSILDSLLNSEKLPKTKNGSKEELWV